MCKNMLNIEELSKRLSELELRLDELIKEIDLKPYINFSFQQPVVQRAIEIKAVNRIFKLL